MKLQQRSQSHQLTGRNVHMWKSLRDEQDLHKTCTATTSTTVVKLQTLKKSACMISYKSGASWGFWCSSCCAAWGAHGRLMSATIKVLWELRGPAGSGFFAVMSITQALSCGLPHSVSLCLGSLHFPQCLLPHQTPASRICPLSLSLSCFHTVSSLSCGKEKKVGDTLLLGENDEGLQAFEVRYEPEQTCHCDLQWMKILFLWCGLLNLALPNHQTWF